VRTFFGAYMDGEPVFARKGDNVQLVTGLVLVDEGLSWADDGILTLFPGHNPFHHLTGTVEDSSGILRCSGWEFFAADHGDPNLVTWEKMFEDFSPSDIQREVEYDLRADRIAFSVA